MESNLDGTLGLQLLVFAVISVDFIDLKFVDDKSKKSHSIFQDE